MKNDSNAILNDLLISWHRWAKGYQHVGDVSSSVMFRDAKTSRGWDSVGDIVDCEIHGSTMESINFQIMEMQPDQRTALQIQARNLVTGHSVWVSPRLPQDVEERTVLLMEARNELMRRLIASGIV